MPQALQLFQLASNSSTSRFVHGFKDLKKTKLNFYGFPELRGNMDSNQTRMGFTCGQNKRDNELAPTYNKIIILLKDSKQLKDYQMANNLIKLEIAAIQTPKY